jgi:uncharacterized alpha/beta hydrolase family protein
MAGMIERLSNESMNTRKSFVINVTSDGSLNFSGDYKAGKVNLIQLNFENNTAGISNQAEWINKTFSELYKRGIKNIDVVAHSMGGESITYYLEFLHKTDDIKVKKFVAIGTPFTWNMGLPEDTAIDNLKKLNIFVKNSSNLPNSLSVLAIAGIIDNEKDGDGVVPYEIATFSKYIFDRNNYNEYIVRGENAQHSKLRSNEEVDLIIKKYLWDIE